MKQLIDALQSLEAIKANTTDSNHRMAESAIDAIHDYMGNDAIGTNEEFSELVKPIMKWIAENHNPHASMIIDGSRAELVHGIYSFVTDKYTMD